MTFQFCPVTGQLVPTSRRFLVSIHERVCACKGRLETLELDTQVVRA